MRRPSPTPGSLPGSNGARSALDAEIAACRRCPLGYQRTQVVVYRGPSSPRVLFVGEAPGAEEDRQGVPFVGRAGKRLDRALGETGVQLPSVGYLNLIKCRPPNNRFDRAAAAACRPFLDQQLATLRPEVVVPLGAHALKALDPSAPAITVASGHPRSTGAAELFPLLHPAAPLHDPRLRNRWLDDLGALARFLGAARRETV
ncbi:MAG: uracil-DNA glycosylase [Thermoplasmata archaeon]|nr:uracil-DNA glycosylase [Thermoplasmata archaeon]